MKGCKEIALPLILVTVLTSIRNSHQQIGGNSATKSSCPALDPKTIKNSKVDENGASAEFVCSEGFSFMSGAASRSSRCTTNSNWTDIPDLCNKPCPVNRHCGDLLKIGLKGDGEYNIFPSDDPKSHGVQASCQQSTAGGGWTLVHDQFADPSESSNSRLIGIENWRALTHPGNDSEAAVVMAVALRVGNNKEWLMAYYDNVTIGPGPDYKLLSIGNYHGNAGDALCHSLGVDFIMDWWTPWFSKDDATTKALIVNKKGSFLMVEDGFDRQLLWGSVTDIKEAWIVIRPKSIDESTTCPNMVNGDVESSPWALTTQFLRFDKFKLPGANITYKCIGDFQMEGKAFKNRTFEGTAICLNETRPRWDRNLTLPCTFGCEDEYTESNKTDECYRAYHQKEALNFLNSAYRCTAEGAHLVRLQDDFLDMKLLSPTFRYYTVHSGMYHFNNPSNPKSSFYQCEESSECDTEGKCLHVNATGFLTMFACYQNKSSICMMPAVCPTDYKRAGGGGSCFKIEKETLEMNKNYGDFLRILGKTQSSCGQTGGALAQPTSLRDLQSLIGFIRKTSPESTQHVLLGLTQAKSGNWISNSFINESLLESNFNSSAWGAVVLRVGPSEHDFITETVDVNAYVCMWPGQLECDGDPPKPTKNMTRSKVSQNISASVQYKCNLGYFINGNASIPVGQTFLCVGNSGNWLSDRTDFPELQDCFKVPVCEAEAHKQLNALKQAGLKANAASDAPGNLTVDEPKFVGGSISYACPDGKATEAGFRLQWRECVVENPDVLDSPQNFAFNGTDIQACRRCIDPPNVTVENSSGGFNKGQTYLDDSNGKDADFVQWDCKKGYEMSFGVTTVKMYCREMGWNLTGVQNCSRVCPEPQDPAADSHMVRAPLQSFAVGSVLHYNCSEGFFYGRDAEGKLQSRATETCSDSAAWVQDPPNFEQRCYHICNWRNVTVANAKIEYEFDHTKETYKNGSIIEAECNAGYEWSFNKTKQTFECTNDGWNLAQKKDCVRACAVSDVRPAGARMTRSDIVTNTQGTKITYTCISGYNLPTSKADGSSSEIKELELTCSAESKWEANVDVESYDCKHPCGANDVDFANATSDFNSSLNYSHLSELNLILTCMPGFEWRFNDTKQNVSCAKTGWDTSDLHMCYRVCPADTPATGESMNKNPATNNTVGTVVLYHCNPGLNINVTQTKSANKNGTANDCSDSSSCEPSTSSALIGKMNVTCTDDGIWTSEYPDVDFRCYHKCMIVIPRLINAYTDFDASKNYSHNSTKTLKSTCDHGYQFAFNETEQNMTCSATGWSHKKLKACYKVCLDPIKPAGEEMTVPNVTKNAVNTTMTYTCNEGYNLNATEDHWNITDTALVTCLDDGLWQYEREDLNCVILCKDDPPAPRGNSTSDWNNFTRNAGAAVTYSCPGKEVFANMNSTVEITCDNGNWTSHSEEFMTCALPCIDQHPPTNISNAMPEKDEGFREHEFLMYNCPPGMATLEGEFNAVLQCLPVTVNSTVNSTVNWWTVNSTNETLQEMSERFLCVDACPGPAVAPDTNWESNWTSVFLNGTVIWYLCPNNSYLETGTERELINKCENNTWSFPGIPYCLEFFRR